MENKQLLETILATRSAFFGPGITPFNKYHCNNCRDFTSFSNLKAVRLGRGSVALGGECQVCKKDVYESFGEDNIKVVYQDDNHKNPMTKIVFIALIIIIYAAWLYFDFA